MKRTMIAMVVAAFIFATVASAFAQSTQALTLRSGFNFISLTVNATYTVAQFKALSNAIEDIFYYSSASGSFISASEGTLSSVAPGKGYIVKVNSVFPVTVNLSGPALGQVGNITLRNGYNLIGFSKVPYAATFSQLMGDFGVIKALYRWSASSGTFISVLRNTAGLPVQLDGFDPQFKAGEAYFIYSLIDTTINYDGSMIVVGNGSIIPAGTEDVAATALTDVPLPEQVLGTGQITGTISMPTAAPSLGGPQRLITVKSLVNIKVWVKDHPEISTTTNENGDFTLTNVPVAPKETGHVIQYEKLEDKDKFAGVVSNVPVVENKKIDLKKYIGPLVIKLTGAVQGRVALSDGLSPLGAEVYISGVSNMISKVDDDGSYSLMYVPQGKFTLTFQYYGYEIARREVTVGSGEMKQLDRVVLRKVQPAATVASVDGYLLDEAGAPIIGALVSVVRDDGSSDLGTVTSTTGHYVFRNLDPGKYKVVFTKDGFKGFEQEISLSAGDEKQASQTLVKVKKDSGTGYGMIAGYVKEMKTGRPIKNAVVFTVPPSEQFFTDDNGFFTLLMQKGDYTFVVRKAGYKEDRVSINIPQDTVAEVEAQLENLDTVAVATVAANVEKLTIKKGQSFQLIPTAKDANGNIISGKTASWKSSNEAVGSVSSTGMFVANGPGECTITITIDIKVIVVTIFVAPSETTLTALKLTPESHSMSPGDSKSFTLKGEYSDGSMKIILPSLANWSSTGNMAALEKGNYMATAAGAGKVTANYGGMTAEVAVTVGSQVAVDTKPPQISHEKPKIEPGKALELTADVADNSGVSTVEVKYKKPSDTAYKTVPMKKDDATGKYKCTIATTEVTTGGIEYYIKAQDDCKVPNSTTFPAGGETAPAVTKPVAPAELVASKTTDKAMPNTPYDLSNLTANVKYADGSVSETPVTPKWEIAEGGGKIEGNNFIPPATEGKVVLKGRYIEINIEITITIIIIIEANPFIKEVAAEKGWNAKVYSFSSALKNLPDFSTLGIPVTTFRTPEINVPVRAFDLGFPGFGKDVVENFAIRYTSKIKVPETRAYTFKLNSDDGSKLYIDGKLVVNNDGTHSMTAKSGTVSLAAGEHAAAVEYFQGPRYHVGLQLFWNGSGSSEVILPVDSTVAMSETRTVSDIFLSKTNDSVQVGRTYNLGTIGGIARYSDGGTAPVALAWKMSSGSGSVSGNYFVASSSPGAAVLMATATIDGVSKTVMFNINTVPTAVSKAVVGWWKFDEASGDTVLDSGAGRNNGKMTGGVTRTAGVSGGALDFNGADGYIDCGLASSVDPMMNSFTVSTVVRMQRKPEDGRNGLVMVNKQDGDSDYSGFNLIFDQKSNRALWHINDEGVWDRYHSVYADSSAITLDDGRWHNIVGVIDRDAKKTILYIDGVFKGETAVTMPGAVRASSGHLLLGAYYYNGTGKYLDHFKGTMDDVKIYNYALGSAEVQALHASYNIQPPAPVATDLRVKYAGPNFWIYRGDTLLSKGTANVSPSPYWPGNGYKISGYAIGNVDNDADPEVVFIACHSVYFPSHVMACDLDGTIISRYWNPGHLLSVALADINADKVMEIIVGGCNNDRVGGNFNVPVAFALDARAMKGEAPPRYGTIKSGTEIWYSFLNDGQNAAIQKIDINGTTGVMNTLPEGTGSVYRVNLADGSEAK